MLPSCHEGTGIRVTCLDEKVQFFMNPNIQYCHTAWQFKHLQIWLQKGLINLIRRIVGHWSLSMHIYSNCTHCKCTFSLMYILQQYLILALHTAANLLGIWKIEIPKITSQVMVIHNLKNMDTSKRCIA